MAARVRLTADVDPELKKRVRIAAIESETSLSEWVEQALRDTLQQRQQLPGLGTGRTYVASGISMPPPGAKPRGSKNPPRLKGDGGTISDAVIEDRR